MAKNTLQSFVSATRQMLTAQLFITVAAIGLAGWTAAVTNNIIRERNSLAAQVLDLKAQLRQHDIEVTDSGPAIAPPPVDTNVATTEPATTTTAPTETPTTQTPSTGVKPGHGGFDPGALIQSVLPPPKLQNVVLHVHSDADRAAAERLVRSLGSTDFRVTIDVLPRDDAHPPGYAYFDPRQHQPAAGIAQQIMLAARRAEIAPWVTSLPGVSMAATADYTADRIDFVLPQLQAATPPSHVHINPGMLEHMEHVPASPPPGPVVN